MSLLIRRLFFCDSTNLAINNVMQGGDFVIGHRHADALAGAPHRHGAEIWTTLWPEA
ncbi:hypothetical protein [Sinorhizobium arboris]|uniref:hypothetical protein n=1 Tax=Sinorhizobium arboris TaxID=76745 RepID=UPI0003FCCBD2|nr:hypothetical protein [Sinorhizobium arboris]